MAREEPTPLGVLWSAGLVLVGLVLLGLGWSGLPPSRSSLVAVEHRGRVIVTTELITEQARRGNTTYRTQRISLNVPAFGYRVVSPARTLWVDDIDRVRPDQVVRFLVDPRSDLVFEATSDGRTLLSYDETAGKRSGRGWTMMAIGLIMLTVGSVQLFMVFRDD